MVEADLYEPVRSFVASPQFEPTAPASLTKRSRWAFDSSQVSWLSEAGDWMRPDVTLINVSRRRYAASADLAVHAIEIKPARQSLVPGLFQALSYSRIADFCWLAAPEGDEWSARVTELARRFGVGLIRIGATQSWDSMHTIEGQRMQPDLDLRDDFIEALITQKSGNDGGQQLRQDIFGKIGRWT